jgi:hypothetical protein
MNTRQYPRTLEQAFGPYTSRHIEEKADYSAGWWAALIVCALVGLVMVGATL